MSTTQEIEIFPPEMMFFDDDTNSGDDTLAVILFVIIILCSTWILYLQCKFDPSNKTIQRTIRYPGIWVRYHIILAIMSVIFILISIILFCIDIFDGASGLYGYCVVFSLVGLYFLLSLGLLRSGLCGEAQACPMFWPLGCLVICCIVLSCMGPAGGPRSGCRRTGCSPCPKNCVTCNKLCEHILLPWCDCCKEFDADVDNQKDQHQPQQQYGHATQPKR